MVLTKSEAKEWASVRGKGKRNHIAVRRVGPANVVFPKTKLFGREVYAQLGYGSAARIMDARIKVKKKRG